MLRDKKIEVRLTKEELEYIKYLCNELGISISELIRQLIRGNSTCGIDKRKMAMHVFNMQTCLNSCYHTSMTAEMLSLFTKEMNELWLCLSL